MQKNKDKRKEYNSIYYKENKEKRCLEQQQYRINFPREARIRNLRSKSKREKLQFDLTIDDLPEHVICPIFKTELSYKPGIKDWYHRASVDRLDNNKGYTKDNVRVISYKANTLKSDCSIEVLERILAYIKQETKPRIK